MNKDSHQLDQLVDAVLESHKYKNVCQDLVRSIGVRELAKRPRLKEAIRATKNKLHQVGGAYLEGQASYGAWLDELRKAFQSKSRGSFLDVCTSIMAHHSSTKERLKILDEFYATTLAGISPIHTVLDVACGLNPVSIPWMPVAENVEYYAYDIYQDMIDFVNEFMAIVRVQGHAQACDVTRLRSTPRVDVAFVLKTIPCLDQIEKSAGFRLLDAINADHLLVSFPVFSLGGRDKGMVVNYENRFREWVASRNWSVRRFEFATELAFLVIK